jgi:hypothetical protein
MEQEKRRLPELIDTVNAELVRLSYRPSTIRGYKTVWRSFLKYAQRKTDAQYFRENHRFNCIVRSVQGSN